ncbi:transmembrane protein 14C-like protein [Filobasidium floriforme]|uniref:transmembrane protein 14C-like protein n=1 Tax=Filobasidium floriforme TaxID=5210 RepID=UPI001E8DD1F4|nr:transmembrane protein 14C-like protein [Filobasidium floriforme]KAH8088406.1 transmembrane protein 14C-like protein [Filobasidium floriforme]
MSAVLTKPYVDYPGYIFAAFVAQGGLMGFIKARSIASLVSGLTSGAALAYGAYLNTQNPKDVKFSLITSLLLLFVMGRKFVRSGKIMPAGMVSIASLIMVLRYGQRLM